MIDELKCKNCGAKKFEREHHTLVCAYCGSTFTLAQNNPHSGVLPSGSSYMEASYLGASGSAYRRSRW